jgi:hypothetical protein
VIEHTWLNPISPVAKLPRDDIGSSSSQPGRQQSQRFPTVGILSAFRLDCEPLCVPKVSGVDCLPG